MTEEKNILRFEIRTQIASKEFVLNFSDNKFFMDVCAFGDFWSEEFETIEGVMKYLIEEWHFTDTKFI